MARVKNPVIAKLLMVPVSPPYASQIASGKREPSLKLAIKIHEKTGLRFGPLRGASTKEIKEIGRVMGRAA